MLGKQGMAEDRASVRQRVEDHRSVEIPAPPTLEELLDRRGITRGSEFRDYQDYIESRERDLSPAKLDLPTIRPGGSMHIALNRFITTRRGP